MSVFEISLTSQEYKNNQNFSYSGLFILNERTNEIRGCCELCNNQNPISYIHGFYTTDSALGFFLMSEKAEPLMFYFTNLEKSGVWAEYDEEMDHFYFNVYSSSRKQKSGIAHVSIKQIIYPGNIGYLERRILNNFMEVSESDRNKILIYNGIYSYILQSNSEMF